MTNEELEQEVKRLEEQIKDLKIKLEEKAENKPYEVEAEQIKILNRGLAFKTKEEAEQFDKERILLFKLHKWAEMKNGDWEPEWSDINENKYYIYYDHSMGSERLRIDLCWISEKFSKLPYFKTIEIARECVDLFGNEIIKVLC